MDKETIENSNNLELVEVESPALLYLGFDQTNPIYQNKKLREAIAYAIDNQTFVDVVFRGSAVAGDSPLPKASPAYNGNVKKYNQDIEKAKKLLAEAGYPNGLDIELWCMDDGPRVDMCVIIQDQLKKIGINVEIKIFEFGAYVSKTALPNKELYFLSWNSSGDGDRSEERRVDPVARQAHFTVSRAKPFQPRSLSLSRKASRLLFLRHRINNDYNDFIITIL